MTPNIRAVISAQNNSKAAFQEVNRDIAKMGEIADNSASRMGRIGTSMKTVGAGAGNMGYRLTGLGYQVNDIVVGLGSGQKAGTVMMQQGSQIVQLYAAQGGVKTAIGDVLTVFGRFAKFLIGPVGLALTAVGVGIGVVTSELNRNRDTQVGWIDVVLGAWDLLVAKIEEVGGPVLQWFGEQWDMVSGTIGGIIGTIGNTIIGGFAVAIDSAKLMWTDLLDFIGGNGDAFGTFGEDMQSILQLNMGQDWMGGLGNSLYEAARKRATAVDEEDAKKAAKEADRQRTAYDKLISGSRERIAQLELESSLLGKSAYETAYLTERQSLLNKAVNDNIKMTPERIAGIEMEASALAEATVANDNLTNSYRTSKSLFKGFFSDFKSELGQGKTLWEALGSAALKALDKIADKMLDMVTSNWFDSLWSGLGSDGGASSGGLFESILGGLGSLFGFSNGGGGVVGSSGTYSPGGADNTLFVAKAQRGEPYAFGAAAVNGLANMGAAANGNRGNVVHVTIHQSFDGYVSKGEVVQIAAQAGNASYESVKQAFPGWNAELQAGGAIPG